LRDDDAEHRAPQPLPAYRGAVRLPDGDVPRQRGHVRQVRRPLRGARRLRGSPVLAFRGGTRTRRIGCRRPRPLQNDRVDQFDRLAPGLADRAGVTIGESRGFGSGTLRAGGRIFAMRNAAGVALKLPATRVTALLASGGRLPFYAAQRPATE